MNEPPAVRRHRSNRPNTSASAVLTAWKPRFRCGGERSGTGGRRRFGGGGNPGELGSGRYRPLRLAGPPPTVSISRVYEPRLHQIERTVSPLSLDVYDFGIARAERAQLLAYRSGIALSIKDLPSRVIGRPPAGTTIVPPSDTHIDSGAKVNAIGHRALFPSKGCCR